MGPILFGIYVILVFRESGSEGFHSIYQINAVMSYLNAR